jgi:hypothetical protein
LGPTSSLRRASQQDLPRTAAGGFAKNERANVTKKEEASLRQIAAPWLARSQDDIDAALSETEIEEVPYGKEAESTDE